MTKFAAHPMYTIMKSQATEAHQIMALEAQLDDAKKLIGGLQASVEALQEALLQRVEYINKHILAGDL